MLISGMSDLLSPILSVMQNEPDAFWCFSKFVSMIRYNFIDHGRMEEKEQQQLGKHISRLTSGKTDFAYIYTFSFNLGNLRRAEWID